MHSKPYPGAAIILYLAAFLSINWAIDVGDDFHHDDKIAIAASTLGLYLVSVSLIFYASFFLYQTFSHTKK
jgi:hypothetical protein